MSDEDDWDDWVDVDEPVEDDCFSDEPDMDAVDSFDYMEEHNKADVHRNRRLKRLEIERTFRVSKDDPPPSQKNEKPLTETKEMSMSNFPQVPGFNGPWQGNDGYIYYTHTRTGQVVEANTLMRQLAPQQTPQAAGYSPYPPAQRPAQPMPMYGGQAAMPSAMPPNTDIYGTNYQTNMQQQQPAQNDYDRIRAVKGTSANQQNDNWSNAPMVSAQQANTVPCVEQPTAPVQAENELRVTTETVVASKYKGTTPSRVAYNKNKHYPAPLADYAGNLSTYMIPMGAQGMDKHNHLVERSVFKSEQALHSEPTRVMDAHQKDLTFLTSEEMQASSFDRVIAVAQHGGIKNNYKPTLQPFEVASVVGALCGVTDEAVVGRINENITAITTLTDDDFTDWVSAFKDLRNTLKENDLVGIARTINQQATVVATDVLKWLMGIDVDLTSGFADDIDELIGYLNSRDDLDEFIRLFMKAYRQDAGLDIGELYIGADECDALVRVTRGTVLAVNADVFEVNATDTGISIANGRITEDLLPELHAIVGQYINHVRKGDVYFYITNVEGGWVKCARTCGKVGELDCVYIVDSGN